MRRLTALLLLATLLPAAQAALVGPQPYATVLPYAPGLRASADSFTFLSGALEADLRGAAGPFGFFGAEATTLRGVEQVCFTTPVNPPCRASATGAYTIRVAAGGAFAVDFPAPVDAVAEAEHALGLFVDFQGDRDLQSLNLRQSLVAGVVDGTVRVPAIPAIATTGQQAAFGDGAAGRWVGLDDATIITVSDGAGFNRNVPAGEPVLFQGRSLRLDTVLASTLVLPFESGGEATWRPASAAAAQEGLDLGKLNHVIDDLNDASQKGGADDSFNFDGLESVQAIVSQVLNGALLRVPAGSVDQPLQRLAVVRLSEAQTHSDGQSIRLAGTAPLAVEGGHVLGGETLYGFGFFQLPWWSYVLWGLALAAFIVRLSLGGMLPKPRQTRWHKLRWIGWITGPLAFILLFWLWDTQTQATLGVSLFSAMGQGADPNAVLVIAGLQLAPFFLMLFAVASPVALLARSGFRLGRQGTFMNLGGTIGHLVAILLGFPLLLSYLDYLLRQAVG